MLFLFALAALAAPAPADWVPMRWPSADPSSLELIKDTPVNCLLLEQTNWSPALLDAAATRNLITLGVIRPGAVPERLPSGLHGFVLEGDFSEIPNLSGRLTIELLPRSRMRWDSKAPIIGTYQAVWPGIHVEEGGSAKAAPSGGPWIDTNAGFLRFARAATATTIWLGNTPPAKSVITAEGYVQAIADAAVMGARWIVALDPDLAKRLLAREARALGDWKRIAQHLAWFEQHSEWRSYQPVGQLALVQDANTGALYSGGVLDMIAVKHTPVIPVPPAKLSDAAMSQAKMAVNVDPSALSDAQKETLRRFTRSGGTVLNGPPDWKFPPMSSAEITLGKDDVKRLDEIWKELNQMTGRRNLGARLFNVSSMISNLLRSPDSTRTILHLVNYSGYPVENVTVHLIGRFRAAQLLAPGAVPKKLETFEIEEGAGTGVEVDRVGAIATLLLEPAS
ncbi:MAG TPA: hypothetical protein VFL57_07000 [Bryobacteraceae bacterium]|nr:hypothetical protein [Bryobacteraceae bacterium]